MRLLKPESVKSEYLALKRVHEHAREAIEEHIDDPNLQYVIKYLP